MAIGIDLLLRIVAGLFPGIVLSVEGGRRLIWRNVLSTQHIICVPKLVGRREMAGRCLVLVWIVEVHMTHGDAVVYRDDTNTGTGWQDVVSIQDGARSGSRSDNVHAVVAG
jgi:hypothetical protein